MVNRMRKIVRTKHFIVYLDRAGNAAHVVIALLSKAKACLPSCPSFHKNILVAYNSREVVIQGALELVCNILEIGSEHQNR